MRTPLSTSTLLRRTGWVPFACLIAAVLVTAVAGLTWNTFPYYGRSDKAPVAAKEQSVGVIPRTGGVYTATLAPDRIEIPKLKATAPIVKVATGPDRELEIPLNPKIVGWWSPGAKPGARVGTAILAGHINYAGVTGTLSDIGRLRPGDRITVIGKYNAKATRVDFSVTGVRTYHKTRLPYQQIFDQKSVGRIALVTCGGPFDASTGNYLDNIVVFAVPTGSSAA